MQLRTAAVLAAVVSCVAAHANLLTNGSFESLQTGWSFTGDALSFAANAYVTNAGGSGSSPYGTNLAAFNAGQVVPPGTISQSFSTVSGQVYDLSFAFGQFGGSFGDQTLTYSVVSNSGTLATGVLNPTAPTTNLSSIFQTYSTTFVGTGGMATLSFTDAGSQTANTDLLLDNVTVSTPAPSALVVFGFGALRNARRRRRS